MDKAVIQGIVLQPDRILALRAMIPDMKSAIKIDGAEDAGAQVTFEIYPEDLHEMERLLQMRGAELLLVLKVWDEERQMAQSE